MQGTDIEPFSVLFPLLFLPMRGMVPRAHILSFLFLPHTLP